eukprot:1984693-Pyramimonas_sp.AAC.1
MYVCFLSGSEGSTAIISALLYLLSAFERYTLTAIQTVAIYKLFETDWSLPFCGSALPQGALDDYMLEHLESHKVPNYAFFQKDLDGSNSHASASWKKFAIGRLGQTNGAMPHAAKDTSSAASI